MKYLKFVDLARPTDPSDPLLQMLHGRDGNENGHEAIAAKLGLSAGDRDGARGFRSEVRRIDDDGVVDSRSLRMQTDGSYEFQ